MRTVLVGLDPGNNDGEPLSPQHLSGARLARLADLSGDEFLRGFDRVNLYPTPGHLTRWDAAAARNLLPVLWGKRVVALGRRVAEALGVVGEWLEWRVRDGFVGASMPHPSGLSRHWNDRDNERTSGDFLRGCLRPCVHVEGVDGSGKSTLAAWLAEQTRMPLVPTDGPPTDWGECLRRVGLRIGSGVVCDRSSGLVSELVYGSVLRGGVLHPDGEEGVWRLVRCLAGAVTFVYCRPPDDALAPTFRDGEDSTHVSGVRKSYGTLVAKYDQVMERMVREGCSVVRYDRTRQRPEEVIACVE